MLFSFHHFHFVALTCICCLRQRQRKNGKHIYLDAHLHWQHSPYHQFASGISIKSESGPFPSPCCPFFPYSALNQSVFLSQSFVETCLSAAHTGLDFVVCCKKCMNWYEKSQSGMRSGLCENKPILMRWILYRKQDLAGKQKAVEIQRDTYVQSIVVWWGENKRLWFYLPRIPHLPLN